jgi:hypothetical protein
VSVFPDNLRAANVECDDHISVVELRAAANECRIPRPVLPLNAKTMPLAAEALDRWADEIESRRRM